MPNRMKSLFLLLAAVSVTGCSNWKPLSASDKAGGIAVSREASIAPIGDAILFTRPLVTEPPMPEPTHLQ